jgi:predicted  nucleic acid-binding Zn-ribbon protein
MYTDMQDSPADNLRRTLFEGRDDERVLIEAFQQEIQELRDELQQLMDHEREQRGELQQLRDHAREQRAEIDL